MPKRRHLPAFALILACGGQAQAALVPYNDPTGFFAAISSFDSTTEDFEGTSAGTTLPSGGTIGGITFSYDFSGVELAVTDGDEFGGTLPAPTTSPTNFLATDDGDLFLGGDDISMTFAAASAIALYIVSAEATAGSNPTLFDGDLILSVGGATDAALDVDTRFDLDDGSYSYFLGLIDTAGTFAGATLTAAPAAVGAMTYVVDDITLAKSADVPVPGTLLLLFAGLAGAMAHRRAQRRRGR
jgi:hypothetical protein